MQTVLSPVPLVSIAAVDDDLVVLDLRNDAYYCLPDLALHLARDADGQWTPESDAVTAGLLQTGLFQRGPSHPVTGPAPPVRSSRAAADEPAPLSSKSGLLAVIARETWRVKGRSVRTLIARSPSLPVRTETSDIAIAEARLFDRWCAWIPGQGQCLYRAYLLRAYLASRGHGATWVFGVRTWPFSAHCWLQIDDLLLDDDLDRVGLYTPILAVGA